MKRSRASIAALLLGLSACRAARPSPSAADYGSDPRAAALAERVLEKMGGREAWERTRFVFWNFMGSRRLWWDKRIGDLRLESGNRVVLVNLNTHEGRAFEKGQEILEPSLRKSSLEKAYAAFINDSYWMFMPYKLRDPGVHLADLGEGKTQAGRAAEVLELTFDGVGLTPKNRYQVLVGKQSGLVEQWDFYQDRDDKVPRLSTPWNGWKRFGHILLCTDHGDGRDWEIAVSDDLPRSVFESPGPVRAP
jgi:hypothetical protein